MIKVQRFVNQLMDSNCFIIYDDETKRALIVDPGSEKSEKELAFIEEHNLHPDYILLTHEHTDHNWGVNALKVACPYLKLVCTELCDQLVKKTNRLFFSFYKDDPNYVYIIEPAETLIRSNDDTLSWNGIELHFLLTPGHSKASMCIDIGGMLFTGDTIMPFPRYLNKRDGNEEDWKHSIEIINSKYKDSSIVYPGHGDMLSLGVWNIKFNAG